MFVCIADTQIKMHYYFILGWLSKSEKTQVRLCIIEKVVLLFTQT